MGKEKLRNDATCLNCGEQVQHRYCSYCGQENTETSKNFYHLFVYLFNGFFHYDSAFWRTIVKLFFKPAELTKEYLSGKRIRYLAPIRVYIFTSFITFLIISLFPSSEPVKSINTKTSQVNEIVSSAIDSLHLEEKSMEGLTKTGILSEQTKDTLQKIIHSELDSVQTEINAKAKASAPSPVSIEDESQVTRKADYWFMRKWMKVKEENTDEEIRQKFSDSFTQNMPKALFLFMPVFAFILFLFHDKKRWNYFDHGIFTLHYFSFLLLLTLVLFFIDKLYPLIEYHPILDWIYLLLKGAGILWMIYYFFPAHRRLYEQPYVKSFFKCCAILIINSVLLFLFLVVIALYTYSTIE